MYFGYINVFAHTSVAVAALLFTIDAVAAVVDPLFSSSYKFTIARSLYHVKI